MDGEEFATVSGQGILQEVVGWGQDFEVDALWDL